MKDIPTNNNSVTICNFHIIKGYFVSIELAVAYSRASREIKKSNKMF